MAVRPVTQAPRHGVDEIHVSSEERDTKELVPARRRRLRTSGFALLLVILLGAGMVALHIDSYRQLSRIDEAQHIDYVHYLQRAEIPKSGDRWLPSTTYAVACRTIDSPWSYPPCDRSSHNGQMPNYGLHTAYIHLPLYYVGPIAAMWASEQLLPQGVDEITVMRATNAVWLVAALILLWLLCRDLRAPWLARTGLSIAVIASPTVLLTQSTVSNDGTALAAGAAITLATLRWTAGRCRMWVPLAIAVVALTLKTTNLAAILLACAFILVRSLQQADPGGGGEVHLPAATSWSSGPAQPPRLWSVSAGRSSRDSGQRSTRLAFRKT